MKILYTLLLCAFLFSGCATTVPSVEEGWIPLDEWNHRVTHTNPVANVMQSVFPGPSTPRTMVRTSCYSSRRYTSCTSY